jgi:hypothetical protein
VCELAPPLLSHNDTNRFWLFWYGPCDEVGARQLRSGVRPRLPIQAGHGWHKHAAEADELDGEELSHESMGYIETTARDMLRMVR